MKQKLLHSFVLRVCLLVALFASAVSGAWADEVVYKTALFGADHNSGNSTYTSSFDATNDGFVVTVANFNNNNNGWTNSSGNGQIKCGRKNNESTGTITTQTAIDKAITKVVVTVDAITTAKVNTFQLHTSSNGSSWTNVGSFTKSTGAKEVAISSPTANLYYKVEIDCASGSSNGLVTVSKVEYYYNEESGSQTDTRATTTTAITVPDGFVTDLAGATNVAAGTLTATVTPEGSSALSNPAITWTSSDESVATVSAGAVTLKAVGSTTITASYAGDETNYKPSSATYSLTVIDSYVKGQVNNPYTVAEAIAAINALPNTSATTEKYYISGIVSSFHASDIISDGTNYRYYISDDGTTTSELLVYRGAGLNNASFSSASDLLVGDEVVIYGPIQKYTKNNVVTPEIASGNYLYSQSRKTASNLTLTSSTPVNLEITSANMNPTSTITWTTSSTGAITCTSDAPGVATVTDAGVITAVGEGTAQITIAQAADATYQAGTQTVTVNVSDNRSYVVTGLDLPTEQKTLSVGDIDDFAATATIDASFTGSVNYTYATSDATVVDLAGETYEAKKVGTATITITATPTGGNADNFKPATQDVVVSVKGTTTLALSDDSDIETFGTPITFTATVATDYDGTLTVSSDNTNVATAAIEGSTITVTSVAVGTATITVTAPATDNFNGSVSETFDVEFIQPTAKETAYVALATVFEETFDKSTGTAGWSGSAANGTLKFDNDDWSPDKGYGNGGSAKFGTGSAKGYAITPALGTAGNLTLTFKAGAWAGDKTEGGLVLSIEEGGGTLSTTTFDLTDSEWDSYTTTITGATAGTKVRFSAAQASKNRFFLDDVKVTTAGDPLSVTLNATTGYATYCSEYPLDFSDDSEFSAWEITNIEGTTITFNQITGTVKGGTGVFLKGTAGATVTLTSAASTTELGSNLLEGTMAPTYVTAGDYYGLKGNEFVPVNAGTIPAGKALLPVSAIPSTGDVKAFTFVFVNTATGVRTVETVSAEDAKAIFNLAGQRLSKTQRGINIVNGKKVVVK